MLVQQILLAAAFSAVASAANNKNAGGNNNAASAAGGDDATGTTLLANAIQTGSFVDGSVGGVIDPGQAASSTSKNNFINNCAGKTLTNGLQIVTGSCNGIPMGDIPAKTAMVSSIITFPQTGVPGPAADTTFNITVQMQNLVAGTFTNADETYYAAPQTLSGGKVIGHTHVTVQDLGKSMNPTTPLDPTQFAFFKGINDAGNGKGLLSATVAGGLPAGNYRVCTMAAASNHQPVLMPVAQRGTPDDCTKFTVGAAGGNNGGNAAAAGGAKAAAGNNAAAAGGAKAAAGGNNAAAAGGNNANAGAKDAAAGGKGKAKGRRSARTLRRDFIA